MHKNINPKSLHKHMGTKHNTKHNRLNNINNVYKRLNQYYKLLVRNKNTPKTTVYHTHINIKYPKHKQI